MKAYIYITAILFLLSSCIKEDSVDLNPNIGNYTLASLTSNIELDLNFDKKASTDFKSELDVYFLGFSKPRNALEFVQSPIVNEWFFRLGLPRDSYHPDKVYFESRYGTGDYSKTLLLKNNLIHIEHIYSNTFPRDSTWLVDNNYPYPHDVVFNDDNKVTIKVIQKFYDTTNEKWVEPDLVGVFEKNW
jgi:hypothetical protein